MDDNELSLWKQVYTTTLRDLIGIEQPLNGKITVHCTAAREAANHAVTSLREFMYPPKVE